MPTTNQSQTADDFGINTTQLIEELAQACVRIDMLDSTQAQWFAKLFQALLARDLSLIGKMLTPYKDTPEDVLLPLTAFCQAWGNAVGDRSCNFRIDGGLFLKATTERDKDLPLASGKTGEISYSLTVSTNKPASGYKHFDDDRTAGHWDLKSREISGQEALDQLVPLFFDKLQQKVEELARGQDKIGFVFGIYDGPVQRQQTADYRQSVLFEKGLRTFAKDREAARKRGTGPYWIWRWENRKRVKAFAAILEIRAEEKR